MRTRASIACALALAALLVAPAGASTTGVIFTHGSTYVPGDTTGIVSLPLLHPQGAELLFTNLDALQAHTVTSEGFKPGTYERLFESGAVNFRGQALVAGVATLPAGTYPFFCSLHGGMRGAIDVVG